MRFRLRRAAAGILVAFVFAAPAADAAVVFRGFSTSREKALRQDLGKSLLPFSALIDTVVRQRNLPPGVLGLATSRGEVLLSPVVFTAEDVRTFALLHELTHQLDFQVLSKPERGRFYSAAGFGPPSAIGGFGDPDWFDPTLPHHEIPAEQFASAVPLVVWPRSQDNTFVTDTGHCLGWEHDEGCRAPLNKVRSILNGLLERKGLPTLGQGKQAKVVPIRETFIPPRVAAPTTRSLRPPDQGVPEIATSLAAVKPLRAVKATRLSTLRVRLSGPAGPIPGAIVNIDYRDKHGWWALGQLETDHRGAIAYEFRPKGWKPKAFRITFAGRANLVGSSVLVPVKYR